MMSSGLQSLLRGVLRSLCQCEGWFPLLHFGPAFSPPSHSVSHFKILHFHPYHLVMHFPFIHYCLVLHLLVLHFQSPLGILGLAYRWQKHSMKPRTDKGGDLCWGCQGSIRLYRQTTGEREREREICCLRFMPLPLLPIYTTK